MKLSDYTKQILDLYSYYNGAVIVDRQGRIEYYYNNRKDINTLNEKAILGKSILDVYPSITAKTSTLFEVMRTGRPIINAYQNLVNIKGERYGGVCSTFPIREGDRIIGAIETFWYPEDREKFLSIPVSEAHKNISAVQNGIEDIVSASPAMAELKKKILKVAETGSTCLLYGETGTGKELVAQAIHSSGQGREKPFMSQNCAAIPENLLESILFGTVKGAFTGAEDRMGLFEAADGGTLFLDEINSMDKIVQAKILRAIEEESIYRVGGTTAIPVNIRVIAATNLQPESCVRNGQLREDLFYRLNVVRLNIPPLRRRREDIKVLADHYVDFFNKTMQRNIRGIAPELMKKFIAYDWPGNVRELRNMVESGFNLCEGEYITQDDIDVASLEAIEAASENADANEFARIEAGGPARTLKQKTQRFEAHIISEVLKADGRLYEAAELLGITRQTLSKKLRNMKAGGVKDRV